MRLTPEQTRRIRAAAQRILGDEARLTLFGSRADDAARGGDIDLYIETPTPVEWRRRAQLLAALEHELGLSCDLLFRSAEEAERPIHRIARQTGVTLS